MSAEMIATELAPPQINALYRAAGRVLARRAQTPWRYDLFQLLRRIDAQGGERYPLGRAPLPRFEPLRIGQQPSLWFAPSTLAQVASARQQRAA